MRRLIRYKIYLQRSAIYISIFNSVTLFCIMIKMFGLPTYLVPVAFIVGLGILFTIGYYDHKYVLERENEMIYNKTPQIKQLLGKLNN